jgi:hypothetical protein
MKSWHRLLAFTGKELRELRSMAVCFALLGMAATATGVALRHATFFRPTAALLDLLVVAALFALLLAERQGADIGKATRRHLLSFPLQPLEVISGKMIAFLLAQALLIVLGTGAYAISAYLFTTLSLEMSTLLITACRILLLATVCWALELAVASWPRTGLAIVLAIALVYALGLVLLPVLRTMFNLFHLALLWVDGRSLLGPGIVAGILIWAGIMTAGFAVAVRAVED